MTNPNNTSQSPSSQPVNPRRLMWEEAVKGLVEASPFKALLHLPPEEVRDLFRSRAGQALLEGLSEWKRRAASELLSNALHESHQKAVDQMYVNAGIDEVCTKVLQLPREVQRYLDATKRGR